jgi:MFS family permease
MGIGRFALTPVLPMMQEDAALSVAAGGWLASANYLGYLVGALSAVVVRIPPSIAIRVGLVAIAATTVGMGFERRFEGWIALRAAAGVASAWVLISVSAWTLGKLTPLRRPLLTSAVFAGVGAGIAAAGALTLFAMSVHASAAQAWSWLGGLSCIVTAAVWPIFARDIEVSGAAAGSSGAARSGWSGESMRLVLCYGAFGFGYIIPATFLPVMAREAVRDQWTFGWAWPIFGAAAAVSTFSGGLSRRIGGNRQLWIISHLVMAVGVSVPAFFPGLGSIMLAALCVGGTFVVSTMCGLQEARGVAGMNATRLIAAMTAAFAVGQIVGPILVSYTALRGGALATPLLIAGGALVISAYLLSAGRGRQ